MHEETPLTIVAKRLLEEYKFMDIAARYSETVLIGGVASGLVVDPDIDISCYIDENLPTDRYMKFVEELVEIDEVEHVRILDLKKDPNYSPFKVNIYNLAFADNCWQIAFSFIVGEPQDTDPTIAITKELKAASQEQRETILKLKHEVQQMKKRNGRKIQSYHIYRAVLDEDIDNLQDLHVYMEDR